MNEIRVLVVDDSAVLRQIISDFINQEPGMKVVGKAPDGRRALELAAELQPDVISLDIQMPVMDGLSTLDALLERRPVPVIMVSTLTQRGAAISFDALDRGAIDYVAKPEHGVQQATEFRSELIRKIRMAAGMNVQRIIEIRRRRKTPTPVPPVVQKPPEKPPLSAPSKLGNAVLALGISTGGPPALARLFADLQPPMPPILVVQHMPPNFTRALGWRLNSLSKLTIKEAEAGDPLRPNEVLIAPGGLHMRVVRRAGMAQVLLEDSPPVSGHKPSVDVMMMSAAKCFGANTLGIIMTGMGRDGAEGCRAIRAAGGYVLGQDEASSDVYGMNKVAFVEGNVDRQFHLDEAATLITNYVQEKWLAPTLARV